MPDKTKPVDIETKTPANTPDVTPEANKQSPELKKADTKPSDASVEKLNNDIDPQKTDLDKTTTPKDQQVANGEKPAKSEILNDNSKLSDTELDGFKKYEDKVDGSTKKKMKDDADAEVPKGKNHDSKTAALVMARIVAEANDKIDTPVSALLVELRALKVMKGVDGFGKEPLGPPGEFRIVMYGSKYPVDPNYTTKRQRNFEEELQNRKDINPEMKEKLLAYNKEVPNGTLEVDEVIENIKKGEVFDPNTKRFGNPTKGKKRREQLMGATPRKNSEIGDKVKAKMFRDGYFRYGPPEKFKSVADGKWYDLEFADMSHKPRDFELFPPHPESKNRGAAVEYWNSEGKKYGPKSKEVRDFMENADNYYLEHRSANRSDGAKLNMTYDDSL